MKLKELPKEERPRERLKKLGAENLSNVELLEILLRSGTKQKDVKTLSEEILVLFSQREFPSFHELLQINGLGEAKALALLATFELGKRLVFFKRAKEQQLTSPRSAYHYIKPIFFEKQQECFYCLYLNNQKKIIGEKLLFQGTINKSTVHPREVFKEAYRMGATGIICFHNHPSGYVEPSLADRNFTKQLVMIGKLQGLPILDHIIVGKEGYYSFQEHAEIEL